MEREQKIEEISTLRIKTLFWRINLLCWAVLWRAKICLGRFNLVICQINTFWWGAKIQVLVFFNFCCLNTQLKTFCSWSLNIHTTEECLKRLLYKRSFWLIWLDFMNSIHFINFIDFIDFTQFYWSLILLWK